MKQKENKVSTCFLHNVFFSSQYYSNKQQKEKEGKQEFCMYTNNRAN